MIIIVSDTHENLKSVDYVLERIEKIKPTHVLHCGDFTSLDTFQRFVALPFYSVFGNCDSRHEEFCSLAKKLHMLPPENSRELLVSEKRIYMAHGDRPFSLSQAIESQNFDYVFHGHTHLTRDEKIGKTRVINPGALQRAESLTFAILDIENDQLSFEEVSS